MKPVYTSGERRGALMLAGLLVVIAIALFFIDRAHRSNPVVVESVPAGVTTVSAKSTSENIVVSHKSKTKRKAKEKKKTNPPTPRQPLDEIINNE